MNSIVPDNITVNGTVTIDPQSLMYLLALMLVVITFYFIASRISKA